MPSTFTTLFLRSRRVLVFRFVSWVVSVAATERQEDPTDDKATAAKYIPNIIDFMVIVIDDILFRRFCSVESVQEVYRSNGKSARGIDTFRRVAFALQ